MEPTPELITQLRRDKILAARQMTPEQRLRAGAELFDFACEITRSGIRMQNPGITPEAVRRELRRRLKMLRARERRHDGI
jgi:hypothetical protein